MAQVSNISKMYNQYTQEIVLANRNYEKLLPATLEQRVGAIAAIIAIIAMAAFAFLIIRVPDFKIHFSAGLGVAFCVALCGSAVSSFKDNEKTHRLAKSQAIPLYLTYQEALSGVFVKILVAEGGIFTENKKQCLYNLRKINTLVSLDLDAVARQLKQTTVIPRIPPKHTNVLLDVSSVQQSIHKRTRSKNKSIDQRSTGSRSAPNGSILDVGVSKEAFIKWASKNFVIGKPTHVTPDKQEEYLRRSQSTYPIPFVQAKLLSINEGVKNLRLETVWKLIILFQNIIKENPWLPESEAKEEVSHDTKQKKQMPESMFMKKLNKVRGEDDSNFDDDLSILESDLKEEASQDTKKKKKMPESALVKKLNRVIAEINKPARTYVIWTNDDLLFLRKCFPAVEQIVVQSDGKHAADRDDRGTSAHLWYPLLQRIFGDNTHLADTDVKNKLTMKLSPKSEHEQGQVQQFHAASLFLYDVLQDKPRPDATIKRLDVSRVLPFRVNALQFLTFVLSGFPSKIMYG